MMSRGAALRGKNWRAVEKAEHQRPHAQGVAHAHQQVLPEADEGVGAFDLAQRVGQAVDDRALIRDRHEVQDALGVGGRLEDRPRRDELGPAANWCGEVAVVGEGERPAARDLGVKRLNVAQARAAGGSNTGCGRWPSARGGCG